MNNPDIKYLAAENYSHCFVGSQESSTRWVLDCETNALINAEVRVTGGWQALDTAAKKDLMNDIQDNEVTKNPSEFLVDELNSLPDWAQSGQEPNEPVYNITRMR